MDLQLTLLVLGILTIAAIYFFSRWQDKRKTNKRAAKRKSSRATTVASSPAFDRDGPSFSADSPAASIDETEPPLVQDFVDADNEGYEAGGYIESNTLSELSINPPEVELDVESMKSKLEERSDSLLQEIEEVISDDVISESTVYRQDADESDPESEIPTLEEVVSPPSAEPVELVNEMNSAATVATDPYVDSSHVAGGDYSASSIDDASSGVTTVPETVTQSSSIEYSAQEESFQAEVDELGSPDVSEDKASLKSFLGSIGPINKIKNNIQNQLESVKAERERALREPAVVEIEEPVVVVPESTEQIDEESFAEPAPIEEPAEIASDVNYAIDDGNREIDSMSYAEETPEIAEPAPVVHENTAVIAPAKGFDKLSQIDYYVKLSGERDVSRDSVLAIYREGAAGIARTHSIYGLRVPDNVWRDLEHEPEESRFGDLVVTIQLVDQDGKVSENDMTRFSSLIMKLSESTGRGFAFMAPIENAHEQADAISRFKEKFDSIFVVNIRPLDQEMFEGAIIERCAQQIGLTPDDNQFFARYKPVGKQRVCLYSLANMSDTGEFDLGNMRAVRTRGVTFFTRPAVNRSPGAVFAEMVDAAKAFASRIKGEVIAPGYEDLSMDDVEVIRKSIESVALEMESYGIVPGSEEAMRLFN